MMTWQCHLCATANHAHIEECAWCGIGKKPSAASAAPSAAPAAPIPATAAPAPFSDTSHTTSDWCTATRAHRSSNAGELNLAVGELVEVISRPSPTLCYGSSADGTRLGSFPASCIDGAAPTQPANATVAPPKTRAPPKSPIIIPTPPRATTRPQRPVVAPYIAATTAWLASRSLSASSLGLALQRKTQVHTASLDDLLSGIPVTGGLRTQVGEIVSSRLPSGPVTSGDETVLEEAARLHPAAALLCALAHGRNGFAADAAEALSTYLGCTRDPLPLVLLAGARSVAHDKSLLDAHLLHACECVWPEAPEWMSAAERARAALSDTTTSATAADATSSTTLTGAAAEWQALQQQDPTVACAAMDRLMALVGLESVKRQAVRSFQQVANNKRLPPQSRVDVTLNFAFLGNPGTGKTTVARLFGEIFHVAGARTSQVFVELTAQEAKNKGADEFAKTVAKAKGGVLFLDEAYDLNPAGDSFKGQPITALLLTSSENERKTTSFIIAGYRDDITKKLYDYNDGFRSRFTDVVFDDFDEEQLLAVWNGMLKERQWSVEDAQVSRVVARRLARRAGERGFGNAREVRKVFEQAVSEASARPLVVDSESGLPTLRVTDVIGAPPSRETNRELDGVLRELEGKTGWVQIKQAVAELVQLAALNYERELAGEPPRIVPLNRLFLGNPGTGKTTCAALYGRVLKALNLLSNGELVLKTASDFIGDVVGASSTQTSAIVAEAAGKVLVIDEAYALDDGHYGKQAINTLVEKVLGGVGQDLCVVMLGYEGPMLKMLRDQNEGLARRFQVHNAFRFPDYADNELRTIMKSVCDQQSVALSARVARKAVEVLARQRDMGNFGNVGAVQSLVASAVTRAETRMRNNGARDATTPIMAVGQPIELVEEDIETGVDADADPFAPLDALFAVDEIRAKLTRLRNSIVVSKREGRAPPQLANYVFKGSPGTGKTTVARCMAHILHGLGMLASARCVETAGDKLQGKFVGDAQALVEVKMREALGGVLFIDEAYSLGAGAYGEQAMNTLVALCTHDDFKNKMVVILAGYEGDMDAMLARNEGMTSRFKETLYFRDWSPSDFATFVEQQATREGFAVAQGVFDVLQEGATELRERSGWGNARDAKMIFEMASEHRNQRVVDAPEETRTLELDDVKMAAQEMLQGRAKAKHSAVRVVPALMGEVRTRDRTPEREVEVELDASATVALEPSETEARPCECDEETRDAGVSDAEWAALDEAKREQRATEERLAEAIRLAEEEMRKAAEAEAAAKDAAERAAAAEASRLAREAAERARAAQVEEERRQKLLRQIGNCPAGFRWVNRGSYYQCSAGGHTVPTSSLM